MGADATTSGSDADINNTTHYGSTPHDSEAHCSDTTDDQFTKQDTLTIIAVCFTHFADAVEIYLPAVITQWVINVGSKYLFNVYWCKIIISIFEQ